MDARLGRRGTGGQCDGETKNRIPEAGRRPRLFPDAAHGAGDTITVAT